jgi:uncharacterized protein (TIGR02246 family)
MGRGMQSDEQKIRDLIATWMKETKAGNIEAVLELMTDDVVFLQSGHAPMLGKAAFAATAKSLPGLPKPQFDGTSEIQEIKLLGDWAYMWTNLTVVVTPPNGATMTRSGYTLSVLRKENGRWLLARDANMLAANSKTNS